MKLMIVRHGDPDYSIDSLTKKGWREAEYLAERLSKLDVKKYYVSPLGRAKDTASCTLKRGNHVAIEKEWLREFSPLIERPDAPGDKRCAWDWLPQDWMTEDIFFHYDTWYKNERMEKYAIGEEYEWVCKNLDILLAEHGYLRDGKFYRVNARNNDILVFFCHFGVECVLLSHILNLPIMAVWHGMWVAPSSVTTVVTEERRAGIASFRMLSLGDTAHLYTKGEKSAFAGRYCECYDNFDERHD